MLKNKERVFNYKIINMKELQKSAATGDPFLRKPLWLVELEMLKENAQEGSSSSSSSSSSYQNNNSPQQEPTQSHSSQLDRHLGLVDLISIGVGGTIGSGIFVLCGLVAHDYAGPYTFLSWIIAGVAALLSGCCYAELSGRIPSSGSSYAYSYISMGELPALIAAACLSLEYVVSGSAVARSWGDKIVLWLTQDLKMNAQWVNTFLNPHIPISIPFFLASSMNNNSTITVNDSNIEDDCFYLSFNPMAFVISSLCVVILMCGVQESKQVTNFFSATKVLLVLFMSVGGLLFLDFQNFSTSSSSTSFDSTGNSNDYISSSSSKIGIAGIMRGATSCFFGYLGFDEICCLGGEAKNPHVNMPRAVMWTICIVTVLYISASLTLAGMQPYPEISSTSAFPEAFRYNGAYVAAQITAFGEVFTLPIVVLISLLAQPRLNYALSVDGLLPPLFQEIDSTGNLTKGTLVSGIFMTMLTQIPFTYLNDLISSGILIAFSMTNSSLIFMRHTSPNQHPKKLEQKVALFNLLSFTTSLLLSSGTPTIIDSNNNNEYQQFSHAILKCLTWISFLALIHTVWFIAAKCPKAAVFGGFSSSSSSTRHSTTHNDATFKLQDDDQHIAYFQTPFVPYLPLCAIFVNWYLIAQLEFLGMLLLVLYLGFTTLFYFLYGAKHSVGNNYGWRRSSRGGYHPEYDPISVSSFSSVHEDVDEHNNDYILDADSLERSISLPRVSNRNNNSAITTTATANFNNQHSKNNSSHHMRFT